MMAQAGATLINLGIKPCKNTAERQVRMGMGASSSPALCSPQSLPANRALRPSCVRILRITLMVELENWPDTGNKKQAHNVTPHQIHRQLRCEYIQTSPHDYTSLHPALPVPPAFLF